MELLGSAFIFASVYLILYLIYQLSTGLVASHLGIRTVLYMEYIHYENAHEWYPHAVKRSFLIGALVMPVVAVAAYILYALLRKRLIFIRLFLLWMFTIATGMLSQRLIGTLFSSNFEFRKLGELGMELSVYGAYMYFQPAVYVAMALFGLLLLAVAGFFVGKPFLQTAWASDQIGDEGSRLIFLRNQVILPFVIGAGVVIAVTFPNNVVPNAIGFACIGLVLMFAIFRAMTLGSMVIPRQRTWERWPLVPFALLAVTVLVIKTLLTSGLRL